MFYCEGALQDALKRSGTLGHACIETTKQPDRELSIRQLSESSLENPSSSQILFSLVEWSCVLRVVYSSMYRENEVSQNVSWTQGRARGDLREPESTAV